MVYIPSTSGTTKTQAERGTEKGGKGSESLTVNGIVHKLGPAGPRLGANGDLHVLSKGREKVDQAAHREITRPVSHQQATSCPCHSPIFLNCDEGCRGLAFSGANCLSARRRISSVSAAHARQKSAEARCI
jgi:hypothetical protein